MWSDRQITRTCPEYSSFLNNDLARGPRPPSYQNRENSVSWVRQ